MPVAELVEASGQLRVTLPVAEREPEPGPRVDPCAAPDHRLGGPNVGAQPGRRQERHSRVVVGVITDQVARLRDAPRRVRVGLDPAALQEERGGNRQAIELIQDGLRIAPGGPIRVLGVERQGDPERACYFSTPVMTMPRVKTRWKMRKIRTGMMRVISVPAWIRAGLR